MSHSAEHPQVTLYVRVPVTVSTYKRQQSIRDRLRTLQKKGRIDELSVSMWEKQIPTDGEELADFETRARIRLYEKFQSWADQVGCSLEPGFSKHKVDSFVTDSQQEVIRFPIICLAAYDDDELIDLAPRSSPRGVYTADDFIIALETGEPKPVETLLSERVESS